jgi:hypothetical protein
MLSERGSGFLFPFYSTRCYTRAQCVRYVWPFRPTLVLVASPFHLPRRRIFSLRHRRCFIPRSLILTTNFHDRSCDMGFKGISWRREDWKSPHYPLTFVVLYAIDLKQPQFRSYPFLFVCSAYRVDISESRVLCMHRILGFVPWP